MLPFETGRLVGVQRPEIDNRALLEMDPERTDNFDNEETKDGEVRSTWEPLPEPSETHGVSISNRSDLGLVPTSAILGSKEIQDLHETERRLREVDSMSEHRQSIRNGVPMPADPTQRDALSSLEDDLADLDI